MDENIVELFKIVVNGITVICLCLVLVYWFNWTSVFEVLVTSSVLVIAVNSR